MKEEHVQDDAATARRADSLGHQLLLDPIPPATMKIPAYSLAVGNIVCLKGNEISVISIEYEPDHKGVLVTFDTGADPVLFSDGSIFDVVACQDNY